MLNRILTLRVASSTRGALTKCAIRAFSTTPASDPLELMQATFMKRGMCDEAGFRLPGVHWTMALAFGADDPMKPPNLRTVGIQRISDMGVDFVVKHGSHSSLQAGCPVAVVVQSGRYVYGEVAEQWRTEGHCEQVPLIDVMHVLPEYTVAHMVAAKRMEAEEATDEKPERFILKSNSHMTEVIQQVRQENISQSELEASIKAFRFCPDRIERMSGGPDHVLWERWEWTRMKSGDCPEGSLPWNEPKALCAH